VLIVNFSRDPVYTEEVELTEHKNAEEVCGVLIDLTERAIQQSGIEKERILGIGIGAPGRINMEKGEIINYSRIRGFKNFPLGDRISKYFGLEVFVANNAGVIAMNAYRRGLAKESHALMTYLIRYGIGGAFITNGQIFSPLGTSAFEMGHTTVEIDGRECYCGSKGCLEAYISEQAILEAVKEQFGYESLGEVNQALSADSAENNEELHQYIKKYVHVFAVSARDTFRVLSPDGFLIITRYGNISEILAEAVQELLDQDPYNTGSPKPAMVYANEYNALEAGYGACDLVYDEYFE
jgi:predicted NBD/HSP70 family sugar kinase